MPGRGFGPDDLAIAALACGLLGMPSVSTPMPQHPDPPGGATRRVPGVSHETSHEAPPVASIGRYRIERLIGNGGFAAVYEARDPEGRRVAIKRLHRELALRPDDILRFDREIRIIRGLRHPNVVEILDVGDDQAPYFVMELLDGTDLSDHIARRGRLSPDETVEILAPVCSALSAAHQKGIVHRDLKASNVFLDHRRVVLLDFGVAKLLDGNGLRLTRSHLIVGSPACMAPEQILDRPVDERTDVYGLGVLAYQMLTGALPFVHDQATCIRQMHLVTPPPPVTRRAPVGPEIDRVVSRAMSKDPSARQPTALAFVRELETARRGAATPAARGLALAIHIHVDIGIEGPAVDRLPEIVARLAREGMDVAFEAGNAATLLLPLDAEAESSRRQRRRVLEVVAGIARRHDAAFCANVGTPAALLRLGTWLPEAEAGAVLVLPDVLEGLDLAAEADAERRVMRLVGASATTEEKSA
jgi:hypothetical protein